jgi:hypothetical protein
MPPQAATIAWGQAAVYNAIDDRMVITALSRGQTGLARAPTLTPGASNNVVVGPWLALVDAGDGTIAVATSRTNSNIPIPGGPPSGSRTDVLWLDIDVDSGYWTLGPLAQSSTVGRLGLSLGTVTVPQGVSAASGMTLTAREDDYDAFWNMPVKSFASDADRAQRWPAGPGGPRTGCLSYLLDSQSLAIYRFGDWRPFPIAYPRADAGTYIGTLDRQSAISETMGQAEPVTNATGNFAITTATFLGFQPRCIIGASGTEARRLTGQGYHMAVWNMFETTLASVGFQARNMADGTVAGSQNVTLLLRISYQR